MTINKGLIQFSNLNCLFFNKHLHEWVIINDNITYYIRTLVDFYEEIACLKTNI